MLHMGCLKKSGCPVIGDNQRVYWATSVWLPEGKKQTTQPKILENALPELLVGFLLLMSESSVMLIIIIFIVDLHQLSIFLCLE